MVMSENLYFCKFVILLVFFFSWAGQLSLNKMKGTIGHLHNGYKVNQENKNFVKYLNKSACSVLLLQESWLCYEWKGFGFAEKNSIMNEARNDWRKGKVVKIVEDH